jgi:biotin carboxylase
MSKLFENKKLLVLGANTETIPLIEAAKKLGVYVIVTDFNPDAPAKKWADKSFDIDGLDVSALIQLCKCEDVNGVIVGVADRLIWPYYEVCKALKLPCYATKEQCKYFTNKQEFNQLCSFFGIETIPNYNSCYFRGELDLIKYPVFIKPTDANSGKGMSVCSNYDELKKGVEKALRFSKSNKFLIERYMQCDDMFIYYTFCGGEIFVSAIADRYTTSEQANVSRVCVGAVYPSKHIKLYFDTLHDKMLAMFSSVGVKNGVFMISAFVEDGVIYLYDPGFRLQGEAPNIVIHPLCGFDHYSMLVNFSLTASMGIDNLSTLNDCSLKGMKAATLWLLSKAGKIESIKGLSDLEKQHYVIKISQRLFKGDIVSEEMVGTEAQVVARIYVKGDSAIELRQYIESILDNIQILDPHGVSILLSSIKLININ